MAIPSNVYISKDPKPKGWSYPLKSSEIVDSLVVLPIPFHIHYDNFVQHENSFTMFSLTYYGHLNNHNNYEAYFYLHIQTVRPRLRKVINEYIKDILFPIVRKWMIDVINDERCKNSIVNIRSWYHVFDYLKTKRIIVSEGFRDDLQSKHIFEQEIDLEKKVTGERLETS